MEILDSDRGEDSDVDGITGGVPSVAGGAEGATSGIGSVEGTVGAGALVSAGMSTSSSGCSGLAGAPWSAPPYAVILVHLLRVNISRQMRLRSC